MRTKSASHFIAEQLKDHLKENYNNIRISSKNLLNLSKYSTELATISQSYYFLKDKRSISNSFFVYTNQRFVLYKNWLKSHWGKQYIAYIERDNIKKEALSHILVKLMDEKQITAYAISKNLKIHQSNLSNFFKKKDYKSISLQKTFEIKEFLEQQKI